MIAAADGSRAALFYTARALPLMTVATLFCAASVPTVWAVARGRSDFGLPLVAASFVGIVAAFAVDDPAGELTAVSVAPLWRRRAMRLAVVGLPAAMVWGALLSTMSLAEHGAVSTWVVPMREVLTFGAIALALAGLIHRSDQRSAAMAGALGAVLLVVFISAFALRWRWLPSLGIVDHHERWWFAAATGAGIAVLTSRDAAARPLISRTFDRSEL